MFLDVPLIVAAEEIMKQTRGENLILVEFLSA